MSLEHKNAIVYGGGGSVGGAVARSFAQEGAHVFLAGRTRESLDEVAEEIAVAGGVAGTGKRKPTPGRGAKLRLKRGLRDGQPTRNPHG